MTRRLVVALAAAAGLLAGCTPDAGTETRSGAEATRTTEQSVPNQVPDETDAVTDAPRPAETDVVLSFVAWDAQAGAVQAGGYVSPVVEDGGTCTLDLTLDGRTVSVSAPAAADASTTACGNLQIGGDQLGEGSWSAVLRYESGTTTGASEPVPVEVPA